MEMLIPGLLIGLDFGQQLPWELLNGLDGGAIALVLCAIGAFFIADKGPG